LEALIIEVELIGLLAFLYLLGVVRGSSICMIACAPGIVPYLISKKYDWRKCLKLAIIFNIPRIIVLTVFGVLIGILAYLVAQELLDSVIQPALLSIQAVGYGFLGIFILIFGSYMFVSSVESKEDLKEKKEFKKVCKTGCQSEKTRNNPSECAPKQGKILNAIQKNFKALQAKPKTLFFVWGGILSIACLGEIVLIELSVVSGSIGAVSTSLLNAALFGGFGMFMFAIGAAMPIIIVSVLSSSISKYFQTLEKLETIRTIGAIVMIMIGLVFIIILINHIISFF